MEKFQDKSNLGDVINSIWINQDQACSVLQLTSVQSLELIYPLAFYLNIDTDSVYPHTIIQLQEKCSCYIKLKTPRLIMLVANLSRVKLISQNDVDILYWLRNQFCEPKPIIDIWLLFVCQTLIAEQ